MLKSCLPQDIQEEEMRPVNSTAGKSVSLEIKHPRHFLSIV